MKECQKCGTVYVSGWCRACGEGKPAEKGGKLTADQTAEKANQLLEQRRIWASNGPTSFDLTDQQWYNVCRFYPAVASRCRRPLPGIGSHNPLHATSQLGLLVSAARSSKRADVTMRQPGEDDE